MKKYEWKKIDANNPPEFKDGKEYLITLRNDLQPCFMYWSQGNYCFYDHCDEDGYNLSYEPEYVTHYREIDMPFRQGIFIFFKEGDYTKVNPSQVKDKYNKMGYDFVKLSPDYYMDIYRDDIEENQFEILVVENLSKLLK